jgi:hypothetical protein
MKGGGRGDDYGRSPEMLALTGTYISAAGRIRTCDRWIRNAAHRASATLDTRQRCALNRTSA